MIEQNQILMLSQIIETIEQIIRKMERAINRNDREEYERAKKEILKFQERAAEIIRE